jgi:hypothetical protein
MADRVNEILRPVAHHLGAADPGFQPVKVTFGRAADIVPRPFVAHGFRPATRAKRGSKGGRSGARP